MFLPVRRQLTTLACNTSVQPNAATRRPARARSTQHLSSRQAFSGTASSVGCSRKTDVDVMARQFIHHWKYNEKNHRLGAKHAGERNTQSNSDCDSNPPPRTPSHRSSTRISRYAASTARTGPPNSRSLATFRREHFPAHPQACLRRHPPALVKHSGCFLDDSCLKWANALPVISRFARNCQNQQQTARRVWAKKHQYFGWN